MPEPSLDAVVVGGGPAGSAAARLLALWGHRVTLVTRPPGARPPLAESVPPSARELFRLLKILPRMEAAGFYPSRGNLVRWGEGPLRRAAFAPGAVGYHIVRDRLDALLLGLAEEAGAEVRPGLTARRVTLGGTYRTVECRDAHGAAATLKARFVLDCSGRSGVLANPGLRIHDHANATVALAGVWRSNPQAPPAEPFILVESYKDGWAWSMPVSERVCYLTMMIDPRRTELLRGRGRRRLYLAEVEKTHDARRLVDAAELAGDISGHTASQYTATRFAGERFVLVGDAASFIDPLASAGVKKALASAWLAAVAVHTCFVTPEMTETALGYFEEREREAYHTCRRHTAAYYRDAAAAHGHGFWSARAASADLRPTASAAVVPSGEDSDHRNGETALGALRRDPDVVEAFRHLRAAPAIHLRPARALRRLRLPVVRGRRIVLDEHLASPALPGGLRFLSGVDLPRLVAMAGTHDQVPALYRSYLRRVAAVPLPNFLSVLAVLLGKGMLVNDPPDRAGTVRS